VLDVVVEVLCVLEVFEALVFDVDCPEVVCCCCDPDDCVELTEPEPCEPCDPLVCEVCEVVCVDPPC
jgi:hypothetical protein